MIGTISRKHAMTQVMDILVRLADSAPDRIGELELRDFAARLYDQITREETLRVRVMLDAPDYDAMIPPRVGQIATQLLRDLEKRMNDEGQPHG